MAPVNIAALAWRGFHAHKSPSRHGGLADGAQVILDNRDATVITEWTQPLSDYRRIGGRVLLKQFGDGRFERIEFARAVSPRWFLRRRFQILRQGAAADPQLLRDSAQRPLLNPVEPVNFADLVRCKHRQTPLSGCGW